MHAFFRTLPARKPGRPDGRAAPKLWALFDWGGTLMSEEGPLDLPMALWPEVTAIEGAHETLATLSRRYRIGVATNASVSKRNMIEVALGRVGLRDYISGRVLLQRDRRAQGQRRVLARHARAPRRRGRRTWRWSATPLEGDVLAPRSFGIFAIWFNPAGRRWPRTAVPTMRAPARMPGARSSMPTSRRGG
jgi:hypothetical protein